MKRSVVLLTNAVAPDKLGGLERYVRDLAAALVASGSEATVVAKRVNAEHPLQETGDDGVRIVRYDVPAKRDPSFAVRYPWVVARAVEQALAVVGEDAVLHAHFPVPALVPALRRRPYVYTLHAPVYRELLMERQDSYYLPRPVQRAAVGGLRAAERLVVRRARAVITLSEFMRQEVATLDVAAGRRTTLVPGGVRTDVFTPDGHVPHGGADGPYPVLFAARRHVPRTGVVELVEAMPAVLAQLPAAQLVLAGDGGQRPLVERTVERLGLAEHVRLLGRVPEEELLAWYRRADLVVTPTQQLEGFGLATAEALACGTPALVTPVGANPEVVTTLGRDLVSADATPAALAAAIVALGERPERLAEVRAEARAVVHPAMGWPAIAERHLAVYEKALQLTGTRR